MMTDVDRIRAALQFMPVGDNKERWRIAAMIADELGAQGRDLWDEWRGDRGGDTPGEPDSTWRSASKKGALTIATLFHEAKANGWRDDGAHQKPTPEAIAQRRRDNEERAAKEEAEIARERAEAAAKAAAILKAATEAKPDHPYLVRKWVQPVATVREIDADTAATILGYAPKSGDEPLTGRLLVVPVKQGDRISTLELIDGDKRKAALAGRGTKTGGYWATERLPDGDGAGLNLLIGEGVATVLSASAAPGKPGIATLSSGNLPAVAKAMRERYPQAEIVILADLVKATGEPDAHAVEAAQAISGKLAVPDFGVARNPDTNDFNDLFILDGPEAVARAIANATTPASGQHQPSEKNAPAEESDDGMVAMLAQLSPLDYDRKRRETAKAMGVRPDTLDKLVAAARKGNDDDGMVFPDIEPWPNPIEPAALLSNISATVRRFIVCDKETADAVALWAAMTWFVDAIHVAPLAVITAPEKRCGKSQMLSLLGRLVQRPLTASNVSAAALFRAVDAWRPTLLVDEADAFMRENEELRGILNAGHTRESAYVVRVVGEEMKPQRFAVWGCKALAGIGHLADTLMDRAIALELRRKLPNENVERLRYAEPELFNSLARKLARFADDSMEGVRRTRPNLPQELHDRAQDNWEPLLAIADVAGGDWPDRARKAALKLSGTESPAMTVGTELLADILEVFETKRADRISTADLIGALCADDEKPWATYNRGKPISPRQVSKRLSDYGVSSHTIRIGYGTAKGFMKYWFEEAFSRYLPSPPSISVTASQPTPDQAFDVTDRSTRYGNNYPSVTPKPALRLACDGVTDSGGKSEGSDFVEVEV